MTTKLKGTQLDSGAGANQVVVLDGSAQLPAVDGSSITNVDAVSLNTLVVGTGANNIVQLDGSAQLPTVDGSSITNVDAVSLNTLVVGTGANNIVQLDGLSKLPAVDGSQLTNLPAASGPVGGRMLVNMTGSQTVPQQSAFVYVTLNFSDVDYDTLSELDITTNIGRYTPTVSGYYQVYAQVVVNAAYAVGNRIEMAIGKNGSIAGREMLWEASAANVGFETVTTSQLVFCNGTTDWIEIKFRHDVNPSADVVFTSYFNAYFVSS